jgi:hypothetical protein
MPEMTKPLTVYSIGGCGGGGVNFINISEEFSPCPVDNNLTYGLLLLLACLEKFSGLKVSGLG